MKQILLSSLLFCTLFASAQTPAIRARREAANLSISPQAVAGMPVVSHPESSPVADRGSVFFYEDFSNGLDGTTPSGIWSISDIADGSVWHVATATSPDGPNFGTQPALNSETDNNGWVIFDADYFIGENPTWEENNEYITGYLNSPEINMTDLSSVLVEFQQFFVYGYRPVSPLTLEVSIDNQMSWMKFPAHGTYAETYAGLSANPLITVVDISCVAAYQPSVHLRWAYNSAEEAGYQQYFWALDDVRIYENPTGNDLEIAIITNGNISTNWEFQATPMEQAITEGDGGMIAGVIFGNKGLNTQPGVTLLAEILDDQGNVVYTSESDPFDVESHTTGEECPGSVNDTLYFSTGFEPEMAGEYELRITLQGDSTDATPNNNTMTRTIFFTDDEYGHDDPANANINLQCLQAANTSPQEYLPCGWGSYYTFPYEGSTAYGVAARFSLGSDNGVEFKAALIQQLPDATLMESDEVASAYYQMASNWQNGSYLYFPFENSTDIEITETYFACIWREEQGTGQLQLRAINEPDVDLSSRIMLPTTGNEFNWFAFFPYTPSVRLIFSDRVGIDEMPAASGLRAFSVYPNPAATETRVNFNLEGSRSVAYEIRDLNGKLMGWSNMGEFPQGENSFPVSVSHLAAGSYMLNIVIDGSALYSRPLVIQK